MDRTEAMIYNRVTLGRANIADALRDCLAAGSPANWEAFIDLAQPVIATAVFRTLRRWNRTDRALADDLIQDTFAKLCAADFRVLRNFRGQDSTALHAYLRVIAASVVTDRLRAEQARPVSLDDPDEAPVLADETTARDIERNLLLDRIEKCLEGQKQRDRWIFWLYHRHGFTPKVIAALAGGLGTSGVETLLYRLTRAVADCVKKSGNFRINLEGGLA
jgi:RNA polymerase sigma factor (sigma-70 family)